MEDARLIGQRAYIYEIGSGVVLEDEEHFLCGPYAPRDGLSPHELIGDAGAPELLERTFGDAIEPHAPWHLDRYVSHLYRGRLDLGEANALLDCEGYGDLRLVDNGEIEDGRSVYHLIPAAASKAAGVGLHMQARGYAPEECIAVGDSLEDLGVAKVVGSFFMVANGPQASGENVQRTESSHGDGFYEAVVRSLME
jgi:hypothetical protein